MYMSSRINLKVILISVLASLGLVALFSNRFLQSEEGTTVGILQTASHPALDQTRERFIGELKGLMEGKVRFVVQNAEGSVPMAQTIAEHFHAHRNIDAIFAIGTPAVQAAARAEKEKPIFIAAVSDPESLGILDEGTNVCGTTDRIDTEKQADFVLDLLPGVRSVAILYNPSESNSSSMVKKMEASLGKRGIGSFLLGVHSESEIAAAVMNASRKVEAILIPADNLLVGAMPLAAKEALKRKCPLIASDPPSALKGALAAQGTDYGKQGEIAAGIAYKVLCLGEKPGEVGIVIPTDVQRIVNRGALEKLGLRMTPELTLAVEFSEPQRSQP